jgi:hypothetical protein
MDLKYGLIPNRKHVLHQLGIAGVVFNEQHAKHGLG